MAASSAATEPHYLEIKDYLLAVRRRWKLLLVFLVAGAALGHFAASAVAPSYSSTARLLVSPLSSDSGAVANGRTSGQLNLDTEAQIARSLEVIERAADSLGGEVSSEQLARNLRVTVPPNSAILELTYASGDPESAQAGATAIAEAFLANRAEINRSETEQQVEALNESIGDLEEQLRDLTRQAGDELDEFEIAQRDLLVGEITARAALANDLRAGNPTPGRIIGAASKPESPEGPANVVVLAGALAIAMALGLVVAVARDRTSPKSSDARALERKAGAPLLVDMSSGRRTARPREQSPLEIRSTRVLVDALQNRAAPGDLQVLGVSSVTAGPACSSVAHAIAGALTRDGRAVVLVACTANPQDTSATATDGGAPGLSDVLAGITRADQAAFPTRGGYSVMGPGTASDLMNSFATDADFARVIDDLRSKFDHVVIVAPSAHSSSASIQLLRRTGAVLLVMELGRSNVTDATGLARDLDLMGCPVVGYVTVSGRQGASAGRWARLRPSQAPSMKRGPRAKHRGNAAVRTTSDADGM